MFTPQPIGYVQSPYKEPNEIPRGCGAKHDAEGVLTIAPEFELGLTDIEGFSHLFVIWEFDRSQGFELLGTPPTDTRPHGSFCQPLTVPAKSAGADGCGVASTRGWGASRAGRGHGRWNSHPGYQAISLQAFQWRSCGVDGWEKLNRRGPEAPLLR